MKSILTELGRQAETLREAIGPLLEVAAELPLSDPNLSATNGLIFAQILTRAENIAEMAAVLSAGSEERLLLASTSRLTGLRDHVGALRDGIIRLTVNLGYLATYGGYDHVDASGNVYTKQGQTIAIRAGLDELVSLEDNALENYLVLASATRPRAVGTYQAASGILNEKAAEAATIAAQLRTDLEAFQAEIVSVSATEQSAKDAESLIRRYLEEAMASRQAIEDNRAKVSVATESIEATRSQATALAAEVRSYEEKFASFQAALNDREENLAHGNAALAALEVRFVASQKRVEELQGLAEQMLGSATIAGLSSEYKDRADAVNTQLGWARGSFYGSVALIALSVMVALNLTDLWGLLDGLPSMPTFTPNTPTSGMAVQVLAGLGSRALIILPALILAGFANRRHAMLFRLREEYSHKSAIAASVHGFKQQAPTHEEAIAAAVFTELLANPALTLEGRSKRTENGFLQRLITPVVEDAMDRLQKITGPSGS